MGKLKNKTWGELDVERSHGLQMARPKGKLWIQQPAVHSTGRFLRTFKGTSVFRFTRSVAHGILKLLLLPGKLLRCSALGVCY